MEVGVGEVKDPKHAREELAIHQPVKRPADVGSPGGEQFGCPAADPPIQLSRDGQTLSGPWHSGRLHGTITLQRVPVPRITLNAAAATPGGKGINLEYTISTTPVAQPLRFDVYRSRTPHLNAGAQLVGSQTLTPAAHADRLTVGSHRVTLLATTGVSADTRRPYVIVVASPNGAALEAADVIPTDRVSLEELPEEKVV